MSQKQSPKILHESRFLRLLRMGRWEYVQRTNSRAAVVVIPYTSQGNVVLVEQFRIPLQAQVIELPAGMVGDDPGMEQESLLDAAVRELAEETGFVAPQLREVGTMACSSGMTDEQATFFVAMDAKQTTAGGGIGSEKITVLQIPLASIDAWLATQAAAGKMMDAKLYSGLYLLRRELA